MLEFTEPSKFFNAFLQGGNFTVTGYSDTTNYDVPGNTDGQTYMLYQGVDMPHSFQLNITANNGNCSDLGTENTTAVTQCAGQHNLCCFDSNAAGYQVILKPKPAVLCDCVPSVVALHAMTAFSHLPLLLFPMCASC